MKPGRHPIGEAVGPRCEPADRTVLRVTVRRVSVRSGPALWARALSHFMSALLLVGAAASCSLGVLGIRGRTFAAAAGRAAAWGRGGRLRIGPAGGRAAGREEEHADVGELLHDVRGCLYDRRSSMCRRTPAPFRTLAPQNSPLAIGPCHRAIPRSIGAPKRAGGAGEFCERDFAVAVEVEAFDEVMATHAPLVA